MKPQASKPQMRNPAQSPVDPARESGVSLAQAAPAESPSPTSDPAPAAARWTCKLSGLDERGQPAGDLAEPPTVGQKLHLACEGESASLARETLRFDLPKEQKYSLRLLETRALAADRGEFIVTTWTAGDIRLGNVVLTDGSTRVDLGNVELTVASVVKAEEGKPPEPYPPWGPAFLPLPWYIWFALVMLVAALILVVTAIVRRSMRRKRLLAELAKNPITLSPYNQFNKDLRRLTRQLPMVSSGKKVDWGGESAKSFFEELNESFRWFLARRFVVPAFKARPGQIVGDVKRVDPDLHKEVRKELYLALTELEKAMQAKQKHSVDDAVQLTELCRKLADKMSKARSA